MKPKKQERKSMEDIFCLRVGQMLDQRYALCRLAGKIDWFKTLRYKLFAKAAYNA